MKNLYLCLLLVLVLSCSSNNLLEKYQNDGINYYKNKNNELAYKTLSEAKKLDLNNGKTNYYLGNVCMNLHRFPEAIICYIISMNSNYEKNNSIFNIACAYSLQNQPKKALIALLYNYQMGDKLSGRIEKDPDLAQFRSSNYYKYYTKAINLKEDQGYSPVSKNDILKHLFSHGQTCISKDPKINLGTFTFHKDGTFQFLFSSGTIGRDNAGSWEIDEKNKFFIIREEGIVQYLGFSNSENEKYVQKYSKNGYFRNNNKYIWIEKTTTPKVEKIPFSKIQFNIYGFSSTLFPGMENYQFYKCMKFNSDIIKYPIGKYISENEFFL